MFRISKEHTFSASHVLNGLPDGHPCGRIHGHNYRLRVSVEGASLDGYGFVMDYHELKPFLSWVDATLDHRHLNDVFNGQPSAENLSQWLTLQARAILGVEAVTVEVSETDKTWASWTG